MASLGLGLTALPTCDLERNRPIAGKKEGRWSKKRVSWAAALTHFPGLEVICLTLGHARLHMQHTVKPASPMSSLSVVRLGHRDEPTRYRTNSTARCKLCSQGRGPVGPLWAHDPPLRWKDVTMVERPPSTWTGCPDEGTVLVLQYQAQKIR